MERGGAAPLAPLWTGRHWLKHCFVHQSILKGSNVQWTYCLQGLNIVCFLVSCCLVLVYVANGSAVMREKCQIWSDNEVLLFRIVKHALLIPEGKFNFHSGDIYITSHRGPEYTHAHTGPLWRGVKAKGLPWWGAWEQLGVWRLAQWHLGSAPLQLPSTVSIWSVRDLNRH